MRSLGLYAGLWLMLALAAAAVVPGVDLRVSGLFFEPGTGFAWDRGGFLEFVRQAVPTMVVGSFVFVFVLWLAGLWFRQPFLGMTTARALYLTATLLIGPALIVETLLKPHWGRARPDDIAAFGGDAAFTPPLVMADQCQQNCSFVSGHAAIAFWLSAYAMLLPPRWRGAGVLAATMLGLAVGLVRIVQGAHFLSDIVFAGVIVLCVNYLLAGVILRRPESHHE